MATLTLPLDLFSQLRRWLSSNLSIGRRGERLAARWLKRHGYQILASNLRNRFGEVDLLAQGPDHRTLVFVEVKSAVPPIFSRNSTVDSNAAPSRRLWLPEMHVNTKKRRQLTALAGHITRRYGLNDRPIRFDVVGVDLPQGAPPTIRHHIAAFEPQV